MSALVAILLPLALALALAGPAGLRAWVYRLAPWAPLVLLWPLLAEGYGALPWPLLGMRFAVDEVTRPLLVLTLLGWTLAGWFASRQVGADRRWFWSGWLGALTGMHMLLLAADIASFYVGYATLSLSAYLLVTHSRKAEAWRAGRVYLVMALAGEAALLVGVLLVAGTHGNATFAELHAEAAALAGSPARWLLLAGFAVKLGILPLHLWLPLAHPVAPVPASAVLSGIIVKAGLAGWLRYVPVLPGDPALVGQGLLVLGLVTAFGGVLLGLGQARLKTVLAYSTISQMGLVLVGFSLCFLVPGGREAMLVTLGLLALHHGLNKASLFLACGSQPGASRGRQALFLWPALALAAAPLTTGFLAKGALKAGLYAAGPGALVLTLLSLTSAATALLMWKAWGLARREDRAGGRMHPAWPALVAAATVVPWGYALAHGLAAMPAPGKLVDASWPLLAAAGLVLARRRWFAGLRWRLPEGDLVVLVERVLRTLTRVPRPATGRPSVARWPGQLVARMLRIEAALRRMPAIGLAALVLGALLWALAR